MIRWFAGHPTAANLLLLLFLAAGVLAAPGLLRETFPDFRPVEAEITVPYRGAAAEDVESAICAPLWEGVQGVEGHSRPSPAPRRADAPARSPRWRPAMTRCGS